MKPTRLFFAALLALALALGSVPARAGVDLQNAAEKMGWQLGAQAYTFRDGSFVTACQKAKELGLKHIEFFPRQPFSDEPGKNFATDDKTTPEQRETIKKALADAGLKPFSYGVVGGLKPDAAMESVCTFAKELGLQFIDCEPADIADAPALVKMAEKYGLRLAIHNHPAPSKYWSPETVLETIKASGAPQTIGSCCDTGHFIRSGLNPLESMRKLGKDSIFFFHWKDLSRTLTGAEKETLKATLANPPAGKAAKAGKGQGKGKGKNAAARASARAKAAAPPAAAPPVAAEADRPHDVPWGTGINDIWAEAVQLEQWGWKGILGAEYETWGPEQMANLKQSFEFMNIVAAGLDDEGWTPLFTDLANAQAAPGAWKLDGGVLAPADPKGKKGDIWTKEKYGDFILSAEFQCPAEKCNSGIFVRCSDPAAFLNSSIEIQILQESEPGKHATGAIYDVVPVAKNNVKPVGEWNRMAIIGRKNMLYTVVNDEQAACINLDLWTEAGKNPDGTKNKFKNAYKDMPRAGVIGLQCHGDAINFRNVKIKSLD